MRADKCLSPEHPAASAAKADRETWKASYTGTTEVVPFRRGPLFSDKASDLRYNGGLRSVKGLSP